MSSNSQQPSAADVTIPDVVARAQSAEGVLDPRPSGKPAENPSWTGWDLVRLFLVGLGLMFGFLFASTLTAKLFLFPQTNVFAVMAFPLVNFVAQLCAYLALLAYMFSVATRRSGMGFGPAIRWNWPQEGIGVLVLTGLVTFGALVALAHFLPMPKKSPFEQFFKRPLDAYAIAVLAVSIGPLMEELAFRGFLYPVLARRFNMKAAILFTALPFALIHYPEYGSWSPVLIVFLVGLVLTVVRAKRQSVAASFIVHAAYNGVQMGIAFVATSGFRHLEKMTQ